MLLKSTLQEVLETQKERVQNAEKGLPREALSGLPELDAHALIVSGVRRCGKSTLLFQLMAGKYPDAIFINFEDPRLYAFEERDFTRLDEVIGQTGSTILLFDEPQIIPHWEQYVRHKLDEGYRVIITGSNASLLSAELGTKLTGRHISKELFPFSFPEFISLRGIPASANAMDAYLQTGGFPEYVKHPNDDILQQLLEDILLRDIAVRYGIRDVRTLQQLAWYLISNTGTLVSGNRLKTLFDIKATSTIMDYFSYLEQAYLLFFVPRFSYSARKQLVNPKKVYAVDPGLIQANSASFSADMGRKLENSVFLHLRRQWKEIYYFSEKRECDFVVFQKGQIQAAIQVCYRLTPDNMDREIQGLLEALKFFKLPEGLILTFDQDELFELEGCSIRCVPVWRWSV